MEIKHFIAIKKPYKENFPETMTEEEAVIMSQHFLYMKELLDKGKLIIAGPEESGKFGVSIFEADSIEHAKEITANDPAVSNNIMSVEVYPYRVSLLRK